MKKTSITLANLASKKMTQPEDLIGMAASKISSKGFRHAESYHNCPHSRQTQLRHLLLSWFDVHGRELPWRVPYSSELSEEELGVRAYRVWVSEIMLQQTQVATVIDYFTKWMEKWPTIFDLAKATQEEVHQVWSGLGYYSRATRLHQSAQLVVNEFAGLLPSKSDRLEAKIPGVGPYTAGAISSIAFNKRAPLVDGNVIRVFSRLFAIASNGKSKTSSQLYWELAEQLVDDTRPGDFNQALMDLGATVCTPQNPSCSTCPVSEICLARAEVTVKAKLSSESFFDKSVMKAKDNDKEIAECRYCEVDMEDISVTLYPPKVERKASRQQVTSVTIIHATETNTFLLVKGPPKGLLANLWDFLSIVIYDDSEEPAQDLLKSFPGRERHVDERMTEIMPTWTSDLISERHILGTVTHIFSHIKRQMIVEYIAVEKELALNTEGIVSSESFYSTVSTSSSKPKGKNNKKSDASQEYINVQWVSETQLKDKQLGVPVTLKKALGLLHKSQDSKNKKSTAAGQKRKGTRNSMAPADTKKAKQTMLTSFLKGSI